MNVSKLPMSSISLPKETVLWLDEFFSDILKRHALSGDLYGMLREAYVLGARHVQIATAELFPRGEQS